MPNQMHGKTNTSMHHRWRNLRHTGKLCPEWHTNYKAFEAAAGKPPTAGYYLMRIDDSKLYEPGNIEWALPMHVLAGTFRGQVLDVVKNSGRALTNGDIRYLLIRDHHLPSSLQLHSIRIAASKLETSGELRRTEYRIPPYYREETAKVYKSYGWFVPCGEVEDKEDTRKVLFIIRKFPYDATIVAKPDRIIYDEELGCIGSSLMGRYVGVERGPVSLKSNEFYENKGWRVIEL